MELRVSQELDDLSCELIGAALDRLADGEEVNVLLVIADSSGAVTPYEFADDGAEACLEAAHKQVRTTKEAAFYALVYDGAVADDQGVYQDAVILEFEERGMPAFSAFSLYEGMGQGERFVCTEPQPAGEIPSLL